MKNGAKKEKNNNFSMEFFWVQIGLPRAVELEDSYFTGYRC